MSESGEGIVGMIFGDYAQDIGQNVVRQREQHAAAFRYAQGRLGRSCTRETPRALGVPTCLVVPRVKCYNIPVGRNVTHIPGAEEAPTTRLGGDTYHTGCYRSREAGGESEGGYHAASSSKNDRYR